MRQSIAPRGGEVLLQSLGADPAFRDEVLGDLAEEYALREACDGPRAARRWYYRECFRVAPYFVRDWLRGLGIRGTSRLASVVAISSIATFILDRTLHLMVRAPIARWAFETPPIALSLLTVGFLAMVWTLNVGLGAFGGYIASRLNRRAPLPTAIALGGVWVTATLVYNALVVPGGLLPQVIGVANVAMVFAGVVAGSALAARHQNPSGAEP